jgi:hypothetical protein
VLAGEEAPAAVAVWRETMDHYFPGSVWLRLPRETFDALYATNPDAITAGVFNPNTDTLMAFAGDRTTTYTWNVIQHEGFHQFADARIASSSATRWRGK